MFKKLKELYDYREMIISLVRKDLRGRYKSSVLGFLWTFINPLCQIIVYTLVFSQIFRMGIEKYYLFLTVVMIPWVFFSSSVSGGSMSVVNQQDLVKKIYFPREVLPISFVTSCFVNMLLSFIVVAVSGIGFNPVALLFLPLIMLIEYILALGITMVTSACTVYLRDLEHIIGVLMMAWIYLTPVMYDISYVTENAPAKLVSIFYLNPMTSIAIAYRDILYYKRIPQMQHLLVAVVVGVVFLVAGSIIFAKLQRNFVEEL